MKTPRLEIKMICLQFVIVVFPHHTRLLLWKLHKMCLYGGNHNVEL